MSLRRRLWQSYGLLVVSACLWIGCATTRSAPIYVIRIQKGDTLAGLAAKYDTTWERIAKLNHLDDGAGVRLGDILRVQPGPGGYAVGFPSQAQPRVKGIAAAKATRRKRPRPGLFGPGANPAPHADNQMFEEAAKTQKHSSPPPSRQRRAGLLFNQPAPSERRIRGSFKNASRDVLRWPLAGEISSHFGRRGFDLHAGIDIRAKIGTPVAAAASGNIEYAGVQNGYGRIVIVRHGGLKTAYAHLASITVDEGDTVEPGQEIGSVGMTGNSSGPHLHFEVRKLDGKPLDPMSFLPRHQLVSSL